MIVTSLVRGRLNRVLWRAIHLLAYLCWPVAFAHSIGSSKRPAAGLAARPGHRLAAALSRPRSSGGWPARPASCPGRPGRRRLSRPTRAPAPATPRPPNRNPRRDVLTMTDRADRPETAKRGQCPPGSPAPPAAACSPAAPEDLRAHLARYGRRPTAAGPAADPRRRAVRPDRPRRRRVPGAPQAGARRRARGRKVIVANGAESEPASHKDAAAAPGRPPPGPGRPAAGRRGDRRQRGAPVPAQRADPGIDRALAERLRRGPDRLAVTVTEAPPRFLAGQESALVNRLGGGPAVPAFAPPRVTERGLGGAPTLVQNVETLAHLALIARYGPRWFRAAGHRRGAGHHAGHRLTPGRPRVIEAELGTPLRALLPARRAAPRPCSSAASTAAGCRCRGGHADPG